MQFSVGSSILILAIISGKVLFTVIIGMTVIQLHYSSNTTEAIRSLRNIVNGYINFLKLFLTREYKLKSKEIEKISEGSLVTLRTVWLLGIYVNYLNSQHA